MAQLERFDVICDRFLAQSEECEEHERIDRHSVKANHKVGVDRWSQSFFWDLRDYGEPCVDGLPTLVFREFELIEVGEDDA